MASLPAGGYPVKRCTMCNSWKGLWAVLQALPLLCRGFDIKPAKDGWLVRGWGRAMEGRVDGRWLQARCEMERVSSILQVLGIFSVPSAGPEGRLEVEFDVDRNKNPVCIFVHSTDPCRSLRPELLKVEQVVLVEGIGGDQGRALQEYKTLVSRFGEVELLKRRSTSLMVAARKLNATATSVPMFGVEVEFQVPDLGICTALEALEQDRRHLPLGWEVERDLSLRPEPGRSPVEFKFDGPVAWDEVSERIRALVDWAKQWKASPVERGGVHVHVSCQGWAENEEKFLAQLNAVRNTFMGYWDRIPSARRAEKFCFPPSKASEWLDHHSDVSVSELGTIEFRVGDSTLDPQLLLEYARAARLAVEEVLGAEARSWSSEGQLRNNPFKGL